MISITVNGKALNYDKPVNLKTVLDQLELSTAGIALALNSEVIRAEKWPDTEVKDNDEILLITATQGG